MSENKFKVGDLVRCKEDTAEYRSGFRGIYIARSAEAGGYHIGNLDGSHIYADWPTIFMFERELEKV